MYDPNGIKPTPELSVVDFGGSLYWQVDGQGLLSGGNKVPATGDKGAIGAQGDAIFAKNGDFSYLATLFKYVMDNKNEKMFYSMGEVTEMFDVKPSLIRYWEGQFDAIKPHKNKKGNRMFTPSDVENLKLIHHLLKEKRLTIDGAKKYLKAGKKSAENDTMELLERLMNVRATLEELRAELADDDGSQSALHKAVVPGVQTTTALPPQGSGEPPMISMVEDAVPSVRIVEQTLF